MSDRTMLPAALVFCALAACGDGGGGATASATAATSSSHAATTASGATSAATSASAAPAAAALTKEAFCERAAKLGEANLAKCTKEDENQRTFLDFKPAVEAAKQLCDGRVSLAQVEFHADVATQCLAAAEKRGGATSFVAFSEIHECRGVLTGKAAAGQPAKIAEECAPGLSVRDDKCAEPAPENAFCGTDGSILGKPGEHPTCAPGLVCGSFGDGEDGAAILQRCVKGAVGERCDALVGNCPLGSTCYQGRCREVAELGAQCMHDGDCKPGLMCDIPGGLFGKCSALKALGEKCSDHSACASHHCRASKCTAFCGGGG